MAEKEERGKRLQEAIDYAHTSQTALAEKLFLTRQNINKICKGKTFLTDRNAQDCASILGVNADYLMLKSNYMTDKQKEESIEADLLSTEMKHHQKKSESISVKNEARELYCNLIEKLFGINISFDGDHIELQTDNIIIDFDGMKEPYSLLIEKKEFDSFVFDTWDYIEMRLAKLIRVYRRSLNRSYILDMEGEQALHKIDDLRREITSV